MTIVVVLAILFVPFIYFMDKTIDEKRVKYLQDCKVTTLIVETKSGWTPVYDCIGRGKNEAN